MSQPSYLQLHASGELARRIETLREMLRSCTLCPRNCRVNRLQGEKGFCRTGALPRVSSFGPHFGEERPLVARGAAEPSFSPAATCAASSARTTTSANWTRGGMYGRKGLPG